MSQTPAPNILMLMTDQHRYDAVGINNARVQTPNIDGLPRGELASAFHLEATAGEERCVHA